jgi:hypothetical protein
LDTVKLSSDSKASIVLEWFLQLVGLGFMYYCRDNGFDEGHNHPKDYVSVSPSSLMMGPSKIIKGK